MRNNSVKLSFFPVILLLILLAAGQGCASKRLAKQAQKLEDAGMYEMAAENYLRSFNANRKNIEAATGLRRNAQRTLDVKANSVNQAYLSGNDRETVYTYLDVMAYSQRIKTVGIELSMPAQATSYYEEAKPRFLDSTFEEARLLLDEENFRQAESIFMEIKKIDPSYQDVSQYMRISQSEPLYRQGVEELRTGLNRKAYDTFSNLLNNLGPYKDAKELRDDALENGLLSIAISDFSNSSGNNNAHTTLKSLISADIINQGNPFIRIVDDRNMEAFLREQEMASRLGSEMKIGRLMAAKALLTGNLQTFTTQEGRLQRTERKAYLREVINTEHPVTKEKSTSTTYHKVTYFEYQRENKATGSFQYQLSSTETGAVLLSGVINLSPTDKVHYAVFDGNTKNLVPGHWEFSNKTSPKDIIQDETVHVKNLQTMFDARKEIKSPAALRTELTNEIASAVSRAVNAYNPEL
ncbi:MAG: tetratricopeptide repeat protein [Bacteroidales bacterium]